jgi:hypothetical protein
MRKKTNFCIEGRSGASREYIEKYPETQALPKSKFTQKIETYSFD